MESKKQIAKLYTQNELEKQFEYVNSLIEQHRISAVANVNIEVLLTSWEVGLYISKQLKSSNWGTKIVTELADYLTFQNPKRRGVGKRHLYNIVKFYETYSQVEFLNMTKRLHMFEFVQFPTAQLTTSEINQDMLWVRLLRTDRKMRCALKCGAK